MSRLGPALARPGKKLIVYVTGGDPSLAASVEIVLSAARAGADVIELGVPFSDPSADGPAIQAAMQRSLARGATFAGVLEVVRKVRAASDVPIVLFGYYNPMFVRGVERACAEAAAAGADGLLVVDLPVDEAAPLLAPARAAGLDLIPLVAPTSPPERVALAAGLGAPFIYYVSMTGVTGGRLIDVDELAERVALVRATASAPVAVGFGIATPADALAVGRCADAVVVGSAIVRAIERSPGREGPAVAELVAALKASLAE